MSEQEIDWSTAPEGATHYSTFTGISYPWLKASDEGYFYWAGRWTEYFGQEPEDLVHFRESIKRPVSPSDNWTPNPGDECEYRPDPDLDVWVKCTFLANVNGEYFVDTLANGFIDAGVDRMKAKFTGRFRPIKSEKQIGVEALVKVIQHIDASEVVDSHCDFIPTDLAEALYEKGIRAT